VDIGAFPSGLQQQQMRCPGAGIGPNSGQRSGDVTGGVLEGSHKPILGANITARSRASNDLSSVIYNSSFMRQSSAATWP